MEKWLLVAASQKSIFIITQKAWLQKNIYLTIVPSIMDVSRRLLDKDYLAVALFTNDLFTAYPYFADIRKIKPNIPILFMPSEQGKSPEEITRLLECVMETAELDRTEQQVVQEGPSVWSEQQPLTCRDLSIYPQFRKTFFYDQEIALSHYQFEALAALLRSRGRVLTFDQLFDQVYGEFTDAGNAYSSARYFISEIRRKMNQAGNFDDYIENIRGVGYRMKFEMQN